MQLDTFTYTPEAGWSVERFPPLDSPHTLLLLFGASSYLDHPEPIEALAAAYPTSQLLGCSTSGEVYGTNVVDDSLVVAVLRLEHSTLRATSAPISAATASFGAGQTLARALIHPALRGVLVLSDGLHVNGSELIRGLNAILPPSVVVTGGLAGDGDRFERTWVLRDGRPQSGHVSAVGLYGEAIRLSHGSKGGWSIFGRERRVTHAEGNVLYKLDDRPALALYKEYLGELAAGLPATALLFPLALRAHEQAEKRVVRTVLSIDEEAQSMTFAGDMPEGYLAQLMQANFDRLIDGAYRAASLVAADQRHTLPCLSLAISCVGRRLILGERTEEELEATLEILPPGTHQIGFYSYGEISPYTTGHCDLHNQTMTLTMISEEVGHAPPP